MRSLPRACPEFLLVAAAVRRPLLNAEVHKALALPIDWNNFLPVVDKHRVAGLVWQGLADHAEHLPPTVLAGLRQRSTQIALRSIATAREAGILTLELQQNNIAAAVVKGPTVSTLAYGDVKVRHCRDIDLLVSPANLTAAHEIMTSRGYQLRDGDAPTTAAVRRYANHSKHLCYVHAATNVIVELHGRLYDNPYLGPQEYLPGSWQRVDVGFEIQLQTLATDDLLLYLCAHGASHGWSRLKWLADFAALLLLHPQAPRRLLQQAPNHRLKRAVVQALVLSDHIFQTGNIPATLDLRERRLVSVAWESLTRRRSSTELYEERFASTAIRLSQLLLSSHPGYLAKQISLEWNTDETGPSAVTASAFRPFVRAANWVSKKVLKI